jgi:hypothetical protein
MELHNHQEFNLKLANEIKELEIEIENGSKSTELQERINRIIEEYSDYCSKNESDQIIEQASEKVRKNHEQMEIFYSFLDARWGKSINLLEIFWILSIDTGQKYNEENFKTASDNQDLVFLTLKMLHGRACLVTGEIVTLLRNGYPDGAIARWRTSI